MLSIIAIVVISEVISTENIFITLYNHPKIFLNLLTQQVIVEITLLCNFLFNLIKKIMKILYTCVTIMILSLVGVLELNDPVYFRA